MSGSEIKNPSTASGWWEKAQHIDPDPTRLNITTYQAHSASKFNETDFIYLKAIWKSQNVDKFSISDYVRDDYVKDAEVLAGQSAGPTPEPNQTIRLFRQNLRAFINAAATQFRLTDPASAQLGPFLNVKWYLERTRALNNQGRAVGGDAPKILLIGSTGGHGGAPNTKELEVISPESMLLDKSRSEDEEIVNSALVTLLITTTLCSGIGTIKGRGSLEWLPKRESFRLGPANDPVCEARTDGILRDGNSATGSGRTLAILEVKPYSRSKNRGRIEWQEACQMAAWISSSLRAKTQDKRKEGIWGSDPDSREDGKGRRLLISQDYRYLYITIAEWGPDYERYLHGAIRPVTPPSKDSSPTRGRGPAEGSKPTGPGGQDRNESKTGAGTRPQTPSGTRSTSTAPADRQGRPQSTTRPGATPPRQSSAAPPSKKAASKEDLDLDNFLVMNCFGPYNVEDSGHMRKFVRNVLALMLEISHP